ncbi:conserved hypothetical protein [Candidatus Nitrosotenuis uzonensis]|uniref:Methyltransferase type 11 domain-containing protein n=1 Tax=Candidatus Nitrosotenuis uzonensis TaxID=1407055 RepID=A0A812EZY9_9ARCH|nr:conserved hypothetical protein [Candidatus Nitrosotenuis uzonensis]
MHWLTGSLLKKFSQGQQLALDLGCGRKRWDDWFNCNYVGIDIYKESKADILAAGFALPFKDNSFSFVTMFSVLEYIERDDDVLKEIHRVLKQKGSLLLISQNARATKANIRNDPSKKLLHKHVYGLRNINKKLKSSGFKPILFKHPILFLLGLYYHLTSVYFFTLSEVEK